MKLRNSPATRRGPCRKMTQALYLRSSFEATLSLNVGGIHLEEATKTAAILQLATVSTLAALRSSLCANGMVPFETPLETTATLTATRHT